MSTFFPLPFSPRWNKNMNRIGLYLLGPISVLGASVPYAASDPQRREQTVCQASNAAESREGEKKQNENRPEERERERERRKKK
jgi:hypothetical protein